MSWSHDARGGNAEGAAGHAGAAHVVDEVADYLAGRCTPTRAEEIRGHLRTCPACAADYTWAAAFRAGGRPETAHLSPDRVAELSGLGAISAPHEQAHLVSCAACARELGLLRSVAMPGEVAGTQAPMDGAPRAAATVAAAAADVAVPAAPAGAPRPWEARTHPARQRPRRLPWRWVPAALAAAAAVVALWRPWQARDIAALRAMAQIEALPVHIDRGAAPQPGFAELRMRGLEAYEGGDYASAAALLSAADQQQPDDPEVLLYLGSCGLLGGDAERAARALERAAAAARATAASGAPGATAPLQVEIGWQLAQAYLASGNRRAAETVLQELAAWQGARAQAVDALLRRVRGQAPFP